MSLIGGFGTGQATEIAGMLRAYKRDSKTTLGYSSLYDRLSKPGFPEFTMETYSHLMQNLCQENIHMGKKCGEFSDIRMQDGSSFAVNDLLEKTFPGRFTAISPAAVELHTYYSLKDGMTHYTSVDADCVSEFDFMPTIEDADLENTLNLFDRGYGSLVNLHRIEKAGGFFVVRMKRNINPYILKSHKGDDRTQGYFENNWLGNLILKKQDYEFDVEFDKSPKYKKLRLIALWNSNTKEHIFLLTNADRKRLPTKNIGTIYRLRWQIELLFKELKSHSDLRKFLTANAYIAEGFIWASLCAMVIRRFLVASAQALSGKTLSFHKAAISARTFMPDFIRCAFKKFHDLHYCLIDIFDFIENNMQISNPQRLSSFQLAGLVKT
jgi:hypothetical protein